MTVIDTSAFIKLVIKEEGWKGVLPFLDPSADPTAPDFMIVEAANVIWKYCRLRRGLKPDAGARLLGSVMRVVKGGLIRLEPSLPLVERSFQLADELGVPVYDALFLALAESLDQPLVTCDRRQAEAGRSAGLRVTQLT